MSSRKVFLVTLASFALLIAATGTQFRPTAASSDARHLEGSWIGDITATDQPGLPPFKNLITFTRDGNVIESRRLYVPATPLGPLMETPGHGEWVRSGDREFAVKFIFLLQRGPVSDGGFVGTDHIEMRLTLDESGDGLGGTFTSEVRDASGAPVFTASGTVEATRIRAE